MAHGAGIGRAGSGQPGQAEQMSQALRGTVVAQCGAAIRRLMRRSAARGRRGGVAAGGASGLQSAPARAGTTAGPSAWSRRDGGR